jgi:hypothetical protein
MSKIEFLKLLLAKKYEKYTHYHNALATEKSQSFLLLKNISEIQNLENIHLGTFYVSILY